MEQEIENADSPNSEEEIVTEEAETPEEEAETVESLTEKNKKLYARAKKAEGFDFVDNQWVKKPKVEAPKAPLESGTLSSSDLLAVMKADVHEDDMDRVERFAKSEGLSIKDSLKNPELKAILSLRAEQRSTASGANISNVRRGATKITDEVLIANANAGKLPESDEDIERLIKAKSKRK